MYSSFERKVFLSNLQMYKMVSVSMIFQLDFGIVPTVWYFLFSILYCHGCDHMVGLFIDLLVTEFITIVTHSTKSHLYKGQS